MATKLSDAWGIIRAIIPGALTFTQIKSLVGAAGLPVHKLAHLQQRPGGASKGQLMDGIDVLFGKLDDDASDRFVAACVEWLIAFDDALQDVLNTELGRVGWGVTSNGVYPLRLQIELETTPLDDRMREGISKTVRRYRDGDFDGAITAICGMVDSLTERVYTTKSLGNHRSDSYQERISKAFRSLEGEFRAPLGELGPDEINKGYSPI
jgi:hypothetical protein